jgi:glycosyltransferase involved in cell wall biosynthesis
MPQTNHRPVRILFVGPYFIGSHAGAMARAFRRAGHVVQVVDPREFIPTVKRSLPLRLLRRGLNPLFVEEFNTQILRDLQAFEPELVVVYKGESVKPASLTAARRAGACLLNVYPDVSIFTHGPWIPKCLPLYDHIFTTKSFGPKDLFGHLRLQNVTFLPHGFDPDVHWLLPPGAKVGEALTSDVSFIGTWSPKKERFLDAVARGVPQANLRIWGSQWEKARSSAVKSCAAGRDIMGIVYAMAIQGSVINIALLSEAWTGASSGDLITSRTFDIPACGGFMLHERTSELLEYFAEGREIGCFSDEKELAEKVSHYLARPAEREQIRVSGHQRCLAENSIDVRAAKLLEYFASWPGRSERA